MRPTLETIIAIWLPISNSFQLARRVTRTQSSTDTDSPSTDPGMEPPTGNAAYTRPPANPRDLEQLSLPADYVRANSGEPLLLWDSGFSAQTRRSFLFGTPDNTTALHDAEHLILDGTFKSSPSLFTQLFTVHGLFDDGWHLPV